MGYYKGFNVVLGGVVRIKATARVENTWALYEVQINMRPVGFWTDVVDLTVVKQFGANDYTYDMGSSSGGEDGSVRPSEAARNKAGALLAGADLLDAIEAEGVAAWINRVYEELLVNGFGDTVFQQIEGEL